jgi:hypothetical protein
MNWISCKDALPTDGVPVLICTKKGTVSIGTCETKPHWDGPLWSCVDPYAIGTIDPTLNATPEWWSDLPMPQGSIGGFEE